MIANIISEEDKKSAETTSTIKNQVQVLEALDAMSPLNVGERDNDATGQASAKKEKVAKEQK